MTTTNDRSWFFVSVYPLVIILIVAVVFSFWSPFFAFSREGITNAIIGTPKYWFDEASPLDVARGLVELGKLDFAVAPDTALEKPYYANSPGFPFVVPLADVFAIFDVGVLQARLYAMLWLFASLVVMYVVMRRFFDARSAFWGTLLVATFTSFYASARTLVGTVPAFLFLLVAFDALYYKKRFVWGGALVALAVVTKPSLFFMLVPAFALEFMMHERPFWSRVGRVALGALPVLLAWIWIMFPYPFSGAFWRDAVSVYGNHYPDPSLLSEVIAGRPGVLWGSTMMYFLGLFILLCVAYGRGQFEGAARRVASFTLFYAPFAFFYFLKSPGWFRYLLGLELLLLLLVCPSLPEVRLPYIRKSHFRSLALAALVLFHGVVFIRFSEIRSGLDIPKLAEYINKELLGGNEKTIGIIDSQELGALVSDHRKYQIVNCGGPCRFGVHPLSVSQDKLPDYIVVSRRHIDAVAPYQNVLGTSYRVTPEMRNGFFIYTHNAL